MITIEDLHQIQRIIYDPNTPYEARKEVENKLESFQNLEGSWKYHIELISSGVDDHLLFLLCLGLNKILWRVWTKLTINEHEMISSAIIQLIVNRFDNLPQYARSKVEQVVATICKNNVSYDIGFQLVNACGQSSIIGISTFRTIFEEVLGTDNRLSPDKRSVLTKAAFDIAPQLVTMACNTCVSVIQQLQSSGNGVSSTTTTTTTTSSPSSSAGSVNNEYLLTSLQLLKVIIAKIPIGPHVNNDTLNLLFAIAELASTSDAYIAPSLSAVETLSEFMNKRYIPSGGDGSASAAGKEAVATALVDLVSKAVNLIRKYCSIQDADESLIILALLHFISAFAECHLERVLSSCSSPIILSQITLLLRELAVLSCTSGEPQYLLKIAEMWETLLSLDMLKGQLLSAESSTVCVPVLQHMVNSCSIQNNPLLLELLDDLEDDFAIEPFADPHIRELVASGLIDEGSHHSGGGSGSGMSGSSSTKLRTSSKERFDKLGGVEEHLCVGTSLRTLTKDCIAEFVCAPDAFAWFSQNLPLLMQQSLQVLGTGADTQRRRKTAAALDTCFYVRLLPLCTPSVELLTLLCPLIQQLVESRIYNQGKSFVGVIVTCIQVGSQIVQNIGNSLNSRSGNGGGGSTAAQQAAIETVLSNMTYVLKSVDASCDVAATAPFAVMISTCTLLLQSLTALCNRINQSPEIKQNIIDFFNNTLLPRLFNLPIEVHSLLICAADQLLPQISQNMAIELHSLASRICSSQDSIASLADSNHLILLSRYCASLDALARHYSVAAPVERQRFIAAVSSLQECVGPLMKACVGVLSHMSVTVIQSNSTGGSSGEGNSNANPSFAPASTVAKFSSMLGICSLILSLTCGLQQSLGKKSFGQSSLQSFDSCIGFISSANGGAVMQSAAGLHFIKGSLQLCSTIALASSASDSTVTYQVALTEKLIGFICSYLSDPYICAELLQDTLKSGTIAIGCYWKSDDPKANISSSQPPDSPSKVLHHSLPACLPIALLLTQLFVGSMDASVSPQDAKVAIEGMSQLNEKHNIFSAAWFQSGGCWMSVLTGCLRSLLLISHPSLADPLVELLNKLQKSDVSRNGAASPLSQGFWAVLGNETYRIASELGVQETTSVYLNELMLRFPQFNHMDMTHYISYVIQPMTADVAKLKST